MMHHVGAGVYLGEVFFLDAQELFYFIIKIIATMWQNVKILNGRMIAYAAGRYMFNNGWISWKMLHNHSCQMSFCFTNIGLVLITRTLKKISAAVYCIWYISS